MSKDNILDSHYCNICEEEFDDYIIDDLSERYCPKCKSTSSERLFFDEIKKHLNDDDKLLFVNPSEVLESRIKKDNYQYYSTSSDRTSHISDEFFDIIIASHVLDKDKVDMKLLDELNRILKKDGILLMRENIDLELEHSIDEDFLSERNILRQKFLGYNKAIRCYGRNFLTILIKKGFAVMYHNPDSQVDNIILKTQLVKDPLFICQKKHHYNNITIDKKEYDDLLEKNKQLSDKIEEILTSNSWKLLNPLRSFNRKIKK